MVAEVAIDSLSWAATLLPSLSSSGDVAQVVKDDVSLQVSPFLKNNDEFTGWAFFALGVIAMGNNGDDTSWQYLLLGSVPSAVLLLLRRIGCSSSSSSRVWRCDVVEGSCLSVAFAVVDFVISSSSS